MDIEARLHASSRRPDIDATCTSRWILRSTSSTLPLPRQRLAGDTTATDSRTDRGLRDSRRPTLQIWLAPRLAIGAVRCGRDPVARWSGPRRVARLQQSLRPRREPVTRKRSLERHPAPVAGGRRRTSGAAVDPARMWWCLPAPMAGTALVRVDGHCRFGVAVGTRGRRDVEGGCPP